MRDSLPNFPLHYYLFSFLSQISVFSSSSLPLASWDYLGTSVLTCIEFDIELGSRYWVIIRDPEIHSFLRAVGRGLCALPIGALVHAAVAIVLGAPVGSRYLLKTCNWSLLMSSLTVVPVASVYGSSWRDWQRIFARTEPNDLLEYMLCIPAHGAVVGAWLGAWPMPLDWERPWQEWPICVTYGALIGYVIGMVASFGLACTSTGARRRPRLKGD